MHPDLVGGALLTHPPVLEDDDPVGEHDGLDRVVGDHHSGAGEVPQMGDAARRAPGDGRRCRARPVARRAAGPRARGASARASEARCCCPPDRRPGRSFALSASPKRPNHSMAAALARATRHPVGAEPEGHVVPHAEVREQQVVLEHQPDRPLLAGTNDVGGGVVQHPSPDHDPRPARSGSSPATARSSEVLPDAVGPEQRHHLAVARRSSAASRRQRPRCRPMSATSVIRREPSIAQATNTASDTTTSMRLRASAAPRSLSRATNTASGMVWVRPCEVSGECDGRPELAERPGPASTAPAAIDGHTIGNVTRRNTVRRDAPECGGGLLVPPVGAAQRRLDGDHQERHGHEGLGDDHAPCREGSRNPNRSSRPLPDQAPAAEREQQGGPADHRRQHHRQHHDPPHQSRAPGSWSGPAATPWGRRPPATGPSPPATSPRTAGAPRGRTGR